MINARPRTEVKTSLAKMENSCRNINLDGWKWGWLVNQIVKSNFSTKRIPSGRRICTVVPFYNDKVTFTSLQTTYQTCVMLCKFGRVATMLCQVNLL